MKEEDFGTTILTWTTRNGTGTKMNCREEIEAALNRDGSQYGKVWRGETAGISASDVSRIWKQLHVMLERKPVKTTRAQKKRWAKRMDGFARRHCLSRITTAKIARRAEWCIRPLAASRPPIS